MSRGYFDQRGNYVPHEPLHPIAERAYEILTELWRPCPECEVGKCGNCNGQALDQETDELISCSCWASGHLLRGYVEP